MIKEYLNYITEVRGFSPHTTESYASDLKAWVTYAKTQGLRWSTLTEQDIDKWMAAMAEEGKAPATRNRRLSALRSLLSWAYHKGMLERNVARFCQSAKLPERLPQALSIEDIDNCLNARGYDTLTRIGRLLISIMLETGVRISEATAIDTKDVNPQRRSIRIHGKGRKERIVFYGERTANEIEGWLTKMGGRLLPTWSQRDFREIIEDTLYPFVGKMHPHQLRHTFGTAMLNNGMPITTISTLMGHKRTETTQRYAKVALATTKEQYEQFKM